MKVKTIFIALLSLLFLPGCEKNENFAPPSNSPRVTFDVEIPKEIELEAAKVMYRSSLCKSKKPSADGGTYLVPGYHYLERNFEIKKRDEVYLLSIPKDGGGKCKWNLSNVTINMQYKINTFVQHRVDDTGGIGFIVVFDNNSPQRTDGFMKNKTGNFVIDSDLYPWINETFIPNHLKRLWLYSDRLYHIFKAVDASRVLIKPKVHSDLLTLSQGPKNKIDDVVNYTTYKYPDGSIDLHGDSSPDFDKLQGIRILKNVTHN